MAGSAPSAAVSAAPGAAVSAAASAVAAIKQSSSISASIEALRAARRSADARQSAFQPHVEARLRGGVGNNFDAVRDQRNGTTAEIVMNWNCTTAVLRPIEKSPLRGFYG